mmetsp:Transcript_75310/g.194150  ORF Transcript_75310/g.194150 Transcript_75310/m.194150 type:complete len:107 (-) Transcript_75310:100-420(-)
MPWAAVTCHAPRVPSLVGSSFTSFTGTTSDLLAMSTASLLAMSISVLVAPWAGLKGKEGKEGIEGIDQRGIEGIDGTEWLRLLTRAPENSPVAMTAPKKASLARSN